MSDEAPLLSIVTMCKNAGETIEHDEKASGEAMPQKLFSEPDKAFIAMALTVHISASCLQTFVCGFLKYPASFVMAVFKPLTPLPMRPKKIV